MTDRKALEKQLKAIGCNFRFWGRAELRELANILLPGEHVQHCINGQYEGGFALLCATDQRLLLIDKKPMYLTLEDIRFDMISEIDYYHRMLNASVLICTPNKSLRFIAYNHNRLRQLFHYTQTRVMDIRHYYMDNIQPGVRSEPAAVEAAPEAATASTSADTAQWQAVVETIGTVQPTVADGTGGGAALAASTGLQSMATGRHRVVPVISAYTRLPIMSRQRRFLGSRALRGPIPSVYQR